MRQPVSQVVLPQLRIRVRFFRPPDRTGAARSKSSGRTRRIRSESNCSDGVARVGLEDPLLDTLGCDKIYFEIPPVNNLYTLPLEDLMTAFRMWRYHCVLSRSRGTASLLGVLISAFLGAGHFSRWVHVTQDCCEGGGFRTGLCASQKDRLSARRLDKHDPFHIMHPWIVAPPHNITLYACT